jgi:hypothetical protein
MKMRASPLMMVGRGKAGSQGGVGPMQRGLGAKISFGHRTQKSWGGRVTARRARGTGEDVVRVLFGPKCSPNLGPIWGEMGCPGEDTGLGQRWVRISAHRCPSGQKRINGEDLGPALEMLLVGGPSWRKSDSRHEDVHDFFYDNLHIFM